MEGWQVNAQESFLLAGIIAGVFALHAGTLRAFTASNRPREDKRFLDGLIVGASLVGAFLFFFSLIIKP